MDQLASKSNRFSKYSRWWIGVKHRKTGEEQLRLCIFRGPVPIAEELDYYVPPDIAYITQMKWSSNSVKQITEEELIKIPLEEIIKEAREDTRKRREERLNDDV